MKTKLLIGSKSDGFIELKAFEVNGTLNAFVCAGMDHSHAFNEQRHSGVVIRTSSSHHYHSSPKMLIKDLGMATRCSLCDREEKRW